MNRQKLLDLYFVDARSKLLDISAFLDRLDRAEGASDFRREAFIKALNALCSDEPKRTERVLLVLSDPTLKPAASAPAKGAAGAYNPVI